MPSGPSKQYSPFNAAVCQRIRNLNELIKSMEAERKDLFTTRDAIDAELMELTKDEKTKEERLLADWAIAERKIKTTSDAIKGAQVDLQVTIDRADDNKLFDDVDVEVRKRDYTVKAPPPAPEPKETRGVGRPGKVKPEAPDPSKGDGVDEHLKASVKELDLPEQSLGKLEAAGLTTVGRVVAAIESKDKDLRDVLNCGENVASRIKAAVTKYRGAHRKAMAAAEVG